MFTYSQDKTAMLLAEIPPEALPQMPSKAIITVSGLDFDKELTSKIRITFNNYLIFSVKDKNPFSKNNWTDVKFTIPAEAFKTVDNLQSAKLFYKTGKTLLNEVESFAKWTMKLAEETDKMTLGLRTNLVYRQVPGPEKSRFLRGICFHGYNGLLVKDRTDKQNLPYSMFDYEYQAKVMRGIGANLIYSDVYSHASRKSALSAFDRVGLSIAQVGRQTFSKQARDIRFSYYFNNRSELLADLKQWLKCWQEPYKMFWAVGIDEPVIVSNFSIKTLSLPDDPKLHKAFIEYLDKRKMELTQNNIVLPEKIDFKAIQTGKQGKPLWLELQKFMSEFLADHLVWLNTQCKNLGLRTIPIMMSHNHYFPQECSYVTLGRKLPLLSTDLYHNGDLYEAFNLQLFRNAVDGTAWMTPGAGYACKTADRFRRSLAISMVHSDGVLQWTNLYSSKYRGPSYFWRGDGTDGQARTLQSYWHWSYWPEMEDMFKRMKHSDPWLSIRKSTNKVILLYSERQAILNTFQRPRTYFLSKYFHENLSLYADLIRSGISTDVGYIETAARKNMSKYKVAILSGARALTPKQVDLLQQWVHGGGTLIVSANTGTQDQWGQPLTKYSLANVYGIEKSLGRTKINTLKIKGRKLPIRTALIKVKLAKNKPAKVLQKDKNGVPIWLSHRFGKGRVIFFAMENIGNITTRVRVAGDILPSKTGISGLISPIIKKWQGTSPVTVQGLPEGVEIQIRKQGDSFVVHLLDWHDNRLVTGQLIVNLPGTWQVFYPNRDRMEKILASGQQYKLRNFRIHDILIIEKKHLL